DRSLDRGRMLTKVAVVLPEKGRFDEHLASRSVFVDLRPNEVLWRPKRRDGPFLHAVSPDLELRVHGHRVAGASGEEVVPKTSNLRFIGRAGEDGVLETIVVLDQKF